MRVKVCGGKSDGTYNLPLHVFALFIVLFQSILCSFKPFELLRNPFASPIVSLLGVGWEPLYSVGPGVTVSGGELT